MTLPLAKAAAVEFVAAAVFDASDPFAREVIAELLVWEGS
jgi:hypothetical protein